MATRNSPPQKMEAQAPLSSFLFLLTHRAVVAVVVQHAFDMCGGLSVGLALPPVAFRVMCSGSMPALFTSMAQWQCSYRQTVATTDMAMSLMVRLPDSLLL